MAEALFSFGAPAFWDLVHGTRRIAIEAAAKTDLPLMIMTNCYTDPASAPLCARDREIVENHGGTVCPVYLTCNMPEMTRRVTKASRQDRRKVGNPDMLNAYLTENNIAAVPDPRRIALSTTIAPPQETAAIILKHFALE